MRWLVRGLAALVVLLVLAVAALAVLLPRLAAREDVRRRIEAEAEAALGRDVAFGALDVALFPPSLVVESPAVAAAGDAPEVRAGSVQLRLAWLPLFVGAVVVDSLVVEDVAVAMVRGGEPRPASARPPADAARAEPREGAEAGASETSGSAAAGASGLSLAVRALVVDGVRVTVEDRTTSPPSVLRIDGSDGRIRARARVASLEEAHVEADLDGVEIAQGGLRARVDGSVRSELRRPARGADAALPLAPVRVEVEGGALRAEQDGAVLALEEIRGTGRAEAAGEPLRLDLAARLAAGGTLAAEGTLALAPAPAVDVDVHLDAVALAPLAAFALGDGASARGEASGSVTVRGPFERLDAVVADLDVADATLAMEGVTLRGPLALDATLAGPPSALAGTFAVDATRAALDYGTSFHKPAGTRARVSGRMAPQPDGTLAFEEVRLEVRNLDGRVSGRTGARPRIEAHVPPFDLEGWGDLVPALAGQDLAGRLAVPRLGARLTPLALDGRIELRGVSFRPQEKGLVRVDGNLVAVGDALTAQDLSVALAGEPPFTLRGRVEALASGTPRYTFQLATPQAPDVDPLLTQFASLRDFLTGPLRLEGEIEGELGAEARSALEGAQGRFRLQVGGAETGGGRIRGMSLLRGVVEELGPLGQVALRAGQQFGGRDLKRFYDDEFRVIEGDFTLADATLRTPRLRLVYRDYTVDLTGRIDLRDYGIDLDGTLTIEEEVDAALAGSESGKRRVIPLAGITGTLREPRVAVSAETVAKLAAAWTTSGQKERLGREIDDALGTEGAGREVLDALEDVLGGRRREE